MQRLGLLADRNQRPAVDMILLPLDPAGQEHHRGGNDKNDKDEESPGQLAHRPSRLALFSCKSRRLTLSGATPTLSLIHISEPTRLLSISYAVFCLKKKKK